MQQNSVICSFEPNSPWLILSPIEQNIKRKIEAAGKPLKEWDVRINYGIKTGFNEAFIISTEQREKILSNCNSDAERKRTEELIRPILRGRDIKRYEYKWNDLWLINTHNGLKDKMSRVDINIYPAVKAHLDKFWNKISHRLDKGDTPYNLRNCAYMEDFSKPKIAWGNLNTSAAYSLIPENYFINAPCVMISSGSTAILKFLNSRIADYYIKNLGVTRNGGYFEYKPMFVELLPLPNKYEEILAEASDISVDQVLIDFYHFTPEEVEVIMA